MPSASSVIAGSQQYQHDNVLIQPALPSQAAVKNETTKDKRSTREEPYDLDLSQKAMTLQREYETRQEKLERTHEIKKQRIEAEYNQKRQQLEHEYEQKQRSIGLSLYV